MKLKLFFLKKIRRGKCPIVVNRGKKADGKTRNNDKNFS